MSRTVIRPLWRASVRARAARWGQYTRLFPVAYSRGWVTQEEARAVAHVARRLGIPVGPPRWVGHVRHQCVFHFDQFSLLREPWMPPQNRLGVAYYHGLPGTPGYPEFDEAYRVLSRHHATIVRVRVANREMQHVVLEAGVEADKVFLIPIGVEAGLFRRPSQEERQAARAELGVPQDAFVVGSLQKDGVGWSEGNEPKLIKGPDVLCAALAAFHRTASDLFVLVTGPARGYVKACLERAGIPYRHVMFDDYERLGAAYFALDACVISSRQEGGPKALLESMAAGVPVVSTRTGQAADLIRDGENGWLVDTEDAEGLAAGLERVRAGGDDIERVRDAAAVTADRNTYDAQLPLWRRFFDGYVQPS
jgi:glycosyltransferase involved in cell wall biosynthesis